SLYHHSSPPDCSPLSLHDALPISAGPGKKAVSFADTIRMSTYLVAFVVGELEATDPVMVGETPLRIWCVPGKRQLAPFGVAAGRSEEHTSELQSRVDLVCRLLLEK